MHCILQDRLDGDIHSHSRTPKAYSNDEERKEAFVGKIREALNLMRNQLFEVCSCNLWSKRLLYFLSKLIFCGLYYLTVLVHTKQLLTSVSQAGSQYLPRQFTTQ